MLCGCKQTLKEHNKEACDCTICSAWADFVCECASYKQGLLGKEMLNPKYLANILLTDATVRRNTFLDLSQHLRTESGILFIIF